MAVTDPEVLSRKPFVAEDVEHVEEALRELHARSPRMISMPGLEHVRNMIAARTGGEILPEGSFRAGAKALTL